MFLAPTTSLCSSYLVISTFQSNDIIIFKWHHTYGVVREITRITNTIVGMNRLEDKSWPFKMNVIVDKFLPPANEVWCKVIFSVACVKNSVHGRGNTWAGTPPPGRYIPPRQVPPWAGTPPWEQCMLGDKGNKRAVRTLLECILVWIIFDRNDFKTCIFWWFSVSRWIMMKQFQWSVLK